MSCASQAGPWSIPRLILECHSPGPPPGAETKAPGAKPALLKELEQIPALIPLLPGMEGQAQARTSHLKPF